MAAGKQHNVGNITPEERQRIEDALIALGVRGSGWFEPITETELTRLRSQPPVRNRDGWVNQWTLRASTGASVTGRTMFRPFTDETWDQWKKERPMLPDDVLLHFKLSSDPFARPRDESDVYRYRDFDRCAKTLRGAVLEGDQAWVIGPSGNGKTQMARWTLQEMERDPRPMVAVSRLRTPNCARATENSLVRGMLWDMRMHLGLEQKQPRDIETATRELAACVNELRETRGRQAVLCIEEGHCLRPETFIYLKRLQESLADGYEKQIGIVVIGQNDQSARALGRSLDDVLLDKRMREVTRRVVQIRLKPIHTVLAKYVEHRVTRAGGKVASLFADGWEPAVKRALPKDLLVPQAVNSLLADSMRAAQDMNDSKVRPEHIGDAASSMPVAQIGAAA